jgi:hypothetical protein
LAFLRPPRATVGVSSKATHILIAPGLFHLQLLLRD